MAAIAGPVEEVTIDGRRFVCAADADVKRDLGGNTVERLPNANHSSRKKFTPKSWSLTGVVVEIDDARRDHEFLVEKANSHDDYPITATFANRVTYSGVGSIMGDVEFSAGSATAELSLGGSGSLEQQ